MAQLLEKTASYNQPWAGRGMQRGKKKKGTKSSLHTRWEENLLFSQRLEGSQQTINSTKRF